jgi:hypothetical protein
LADHGEFDEGTLLDIGWKAFGTFFVPDFLSLLVGEIYQHTLKIAYLRLASIFEIRNAQKQQKLGWLSS